MRTRIAIALAFISVLHRDAAAQSPDARAIVIAVADSALAAITRGDVVALALSSRQCASRIRRGRL